MKRIVTDLKLGCPRFSIPKEPGELSRFIQLWKSVLNTGAYPDFVFKEAVPVLIRDLSGSDNPPTAGDLYRACKKRMEEIERDPERRKRLYAWREKKRDELIEADRRRRG
ncbi:hypothetical protein ACEN19_11150 [Corynebacterium auriscanis]|uniref:hypothetical protein n=1 Tax=Corynebacterium auriscanis TaxID=99807 RepID=UPI003CED6E5E